MKNIKQLRPRRRQRGFGDFRLLDARNGGIKFLANVRDIKPEIPRIILTGYADKENAIKAINAISLFQYVEKPWNNADFLIIIRNGIEKKKLPQEFSNIFAEINSAYGDLQTIQKENIKTFS